MALATTELPFRTPVYVDGYNLYYGCLRATPCKVARSPETVGATDLPLDLDRWHGKKPAPNTMPK